ncbi:MFS transporter [Paraburkholderia caballeronis]|uniref:Predicted arabinose efflux permease, MFS family n=1 Tax=Paraburkholderia caballeronis TaxID=416943 RepID=A0A1H7QIC2_9BURK|nr:MFS transporter [Paraburkholderia caballeronis]PXW22558.1 putative MFS family arabinose efflux permease [Paraburkholderia caballeronis]PXW96429.1 putative MFS family arabinose efflux permease [Paraburkholderia caballeronis]RAJ92840.1 putative MFS family arabinose efflux permease [Paraburkholderia caballeronis]SEE06437.1 Predicted arabinose efflux permease, MFS family [Paraburkholderia caballeronis]SEL47325.1 Predicted arabinose efflux permease, MFS family [Paraburkholderia caballeronis]
MHATNLGASAPAPARALARGDYKTLALAALGGALEFYDFIIFVFFAPVIGQLFFPAAIPDWLRQLQTFGIFAAGYLARPLGGIVMAHFGDLLGRKRMFTLSVLLMALPTLAMGLLPTYATIGVFAPVLLLALRVLQGAAVGGEVPGAWVFVSEHVPRRHVGYACGTLTAGLTAGILLGSLIAAAVNHHFAPADIASYGWRIPFLLGGAFGLVSVRLRQWLHETPVFAEMQQRKSLAAEIPLKAVLRDHGRAVIVSMLLTWMLSAAIVVVILMTPPLLQKQFHIDATTSLLANCVATLCLTVGCVSAGSLAGRFGARPTLAIGGILLAVSYYAMYRQLAVDTSLLMPLYAVTGFLVGTIGGVPLVMVNAFPPVVRFSGISFSYNVAYAVFGGLTPIVVALLMKSAPMAPALYVAAVCALGVVTALFVKETPARG